MMICKNDGQVARVYECVYFCIYAIMQQNSSALALKRSQWKAQLRRHDLETLFTKRRQQLSLAETHQLPLLTDQQRLDLIHQIIEDINHEPLSQILSIIIQIDNSLQLLFAVTAVLPENVPAFFADTIRDALSQKSVPSKIELQFIKDNRYWVVQHKYNIMLIGHTFQAWLKNNGSSFLKLKALLQSMNELDLAIQPPIINFIGLMTNILLIVVWAQEILLSEAESMGEVQPQRQYELNSCLFIFTNFLAGRDELILPHLPTIFNWVCNHIKSIALYFNLFLVTGVDAELKFHFFKNYLRLLNLHSQEFMEQHKELIFILANGLKFMPEMPPHLQQEFTEQALKLQELLSQLLKVLNLRYQNTELYLPAHSISSDDEDKSFVQQMSIVLLKLSEDKYVLYSLMESPSVMKFIFSNLEPNQHHLSLKIGIYLSMVLKKATQDEYAFAQLLHQPRFIQKILKLLTKMKEKSANSNSRQTAMFMDSILEILAKCCGQRDILNDFLKCNLVETVIQLYFQLQSSQIWRDVRLDCKIFHLNIITGAKQLWFNECEEREIVIGVLFGNQRTRGMYIECLAEEDPSVVAMAIQILSLLLIAEDRCHYNRYLDHFLSNTCLLQQLQLMSKSTKDSEREVGEQGVRLLRERMRRREEAREEDEDEL